MLTFLYSFSSVAQLFPVNITPQVVPPYSLKLSEYGTSVSDKLILNALLIDITESNLPVKFKIYIENNAGLSIQSADVVIGANPVFLDGGTPLRLSTIDLQPYFALQNLKGITPQQYSVPLPEGLYRFCFEAYDTQSGRRVSRKSCATVYLVLNDPPFLNIPNRGEQVPMRDPQNIVFQWTPRHLNATNVQYEFTLAELWDDQMNPQAAFLASRPLYQTTTYATTLLYGPAEPQLLPDKKYAWRVRALVSDGISETSVFKNNGYSEIYHFTYAGNCAEPAYILAEATGTTKEKILWQGVDHLKYNVQYRKKDVENAVWFDAVTVNQYTTLHNLKPGTTYEFRVGGQCLENGPFTYSQIYEFTTILVPDETATYNCGITPEIVITNQNPLEALVINDVFTAGDFPVTVKSVTSGNVAAPDVGEVAQGGNGTFSGWGYIVVPYLQDTKLKVSFNNIRINTDYQLTDGIVITDYDENWGGVDDIGNELDALLNLKDAILQALNLDISSDTKDKIDKIIDAIVNQIDKENLPDTIKDDIRESANDMQEASDSYDEARQVYENEEATKEEKEAAKEQMNVAEKEFKEAQNNLKDANEAAEKYKKQVADLLKKAIFEIYREGKDRSNQFQTDYQEELNKFNYAEEVADDGSIVVFEGGFVDNEYTTVDTAFVNLERDFSSYLFTSMLNDSDEALLNNFIDISKKVGYAYVDIVKKGREENKEDKDIIEELKKALKSSFLEILVQSNFAE
jgi:hypothetical protein